jgi:DnaJ homolog subfamily C member 2
MEHHRNLNFTSKLMKYIVRKRIHAEKDMQQQQQQQQVQSLNPATRKKEKKENMDGIDGLDDEEITEQNNGVDEKQQQQLPKEEIEKPKPKATTTKTTKKNRTASSLFDYTEQELMHDGVLTHYEMLNIADPFACSQDAVKKAYRKASLKYHPDKTGRGDDDYVFRAVKMAHDVLMDHTKRQAYDSTILPFDDAIPAARSVLLQDASLLYTDDDFYATFGPVFQRNLRFDAKLRPEAASNKKKSLSSSSTSSSSNGGSSNNNKNNTHKKGKGPHAVAPMLGAADTPMEDVHAFYDYWIHFDSWRDFSAQAAEELEVENQLENAESRFEKRWIQKEIDKRAKQLKTRENGRIQQLVERSMECDPRLRQARLEAIQAKERQALQRQAAAERVQQAKKDEALAQEQAAVELEKLRVVEKERREQEKKLLRKARQHLRRITSSAYIHLSQALASPTSCCTADYDDDDHVTLIWPDSYDMGVDVDVICSNLDLEQLKGLVMEFERMTNQHHHSDGNVQHQAQALAMIQQRAIHERTLAAATNNSNRLKTASSTVSDDDNDDVDNDNGDTTTRAGTSNDPWTKEELSTLAKGVKKYPPGGSSRWDQITLYMSNICKKSCPRTKEECIAKYNEVARNNSSSSSNVSSGTAPAESKTNGNKSSPTMPSSSSLPSAKEAAAAVSNGNKSAAAPLPSPARAAAAAAATTTAPPSVADSNNDCWTAEQDEQLQAALSKFPVSMDKNERWTAIAAAVTDKTKKQCVQRFKVIREALQKKK